MRYTYQRCCQRTMDAHNGCVREVRDVRGALAHARAYKQPADVRLPEALARVVRVQFRFCVAVVRAVAA
jgi:hypothetical protein